MLIPDYLTEIEFAATQVLSAIWSERARATELSAEINTLAPAVEDTYRRALYLQQSEDLDDVAMGAGVYWENYFGDDKDLYHNKAEFQELQTLLAIHEFSVGSLSGTLLQYGKHAISIAHGGLGTCPDGRLIGTQPIKSIIWQGRNHAAHWEAGNPHQPVRDCFNALAAEQDRKFGNFLTQNMAFDVVELLGWQSFGNFEADLLLLQ